jgi:hypothetical protein
MLNSGTYQMHHLPPSTALTAALMLIGRRLKVVVLVMVMFTLTGTSTSLPSACQVCNHDRGHTVHIHRL